MKTSSKLRRLQRKRKLRRQRSAFFMIVMVLVVMMAHSVLSNQTTDETYEVISVTVQPGDTMWEIASKYKPANSDTRDFMYEIAANNGVKDCNIISGQTLYIPICE